MRDLRAATSIAYDDRQRGLLQLFRTEKQANGAADDIHVLEKLGVPYEVLDRAGCVVHEPGLRGTTEKFVGGLRLPGDETGDARLFTQRLADLARQAGVVFRMATNIRELRTEGNRISGVQNRPGCHYRGYLRDGARQLFAAAARQTGHPAARIPRQGLLHYGSHCVEQAAPVSTVMDETFKVAITRLGDRIRVGGTAELGGWSTKLREVRRGTLVHSLTDLFPAPETCRRPASGPAFAR